ncbi:MAG TPA: nucleotidyltransferase [Lachnospiraceae bacterium]|jgi:nucleotidyltransferase substrate binding protein (TIGR01987 family)|nr:nucleotidyltransferase [Lachnospiraceae bacterium]
MKEIENFSGSLRVLEKADFTLADRDDIYRTGIIEQCDLTFELAWKALQKVLTLRGVSDAKTKTPLEILQLGCNEGLIRDPKIWRTMLENRGLSVLLGSREKIDERILLIRDRFIPAFTDLEETLVGKLSEAEQLHI